MNENKKENQAPAQEKQPTTPEQVRAKIEELTTLKAKQLQEIQQKQDEAKAELAAAEQASKDAAAALDLDSYEAAEAKKNRWKTAFDMYSKRYEQIEKQEYITEAESDKVIESLLKYEEDIAAEFEANIRKPLEALKGILAEYKKEVENAESVMRNWTGNIHANYINRNAFYPATGSNRAETARPVRSAQYTGSNASNRLEKLLKEVFSEIQQR